MTPPTPVAAMRSVHTPGPWLFARTSEGEGYVLSIRHQAGGVQHAISAVWDDNAMAIGEGVANARLIATAPDLLRCTDLLESLCAWLLHRFGPDGPEGREAQFRLVAARAALSRASEGNGGA